MSLTWVQPEDFPAAREYVKSMKLPYELHETKNSQQVRNELFSFVTSSYQLGKPIMGHLVSCKNEILKNAKTKNLLVPNEVEWFKVSDYFSADLPARKMFVSEFDLVAAYWTVAYRMGFISQATYEKFLRFKTKRFRLLALGMLAKREYIRRYNEKGELIESSIKVDEIGVQIFRRIAYEISEEMNRLSLWREEDFRFYWFDNIIFDPAVQKLDTDFAYKYKSEVLQLLFVPRRRMILKLGDRDFMFPSSKAFKDGRSLVPESWRVDPARQSTKWDENIYKDL